MSDEEYLVVNAESGDELNQSMEADTTDAYSTHSGVAAGVASSTSSQDPGGSTQSSTAQQSVGVPVLCNITQALGYATGMYCRPGDSGVNRWEWMVVMNHLEKLQRGEPLTRSERRLLLAHIRFAPEVESQYGLLEGIGEMVTPEPPRVLPEGSSLGGAPSSMDAPASPPGTTCEDITEITTPEQPVLPEGPGGAPSSMDAPASPPAPLVEVPARPGGAPSPVDAPASPLAPLVEVPVPPGGAPFVMEEPQLSVPVTKLDARTKELMADLQSIPTRDGEEERPIEPPPSNFDFDAFMRQGRESDGSERRVTARPGLVGRPVTARAGSVGHRTTAAAATSGLAAATETSSAVPTNPARTVIARATTADTTLIGVAMLPPADRTPVAPHPATARFGERRIRTSPPPDGRQHLTLREAVERQNLEAMQEEVERRHEDLMRARSRERREAHFSERLLALREGARARERDRVAREERVVRDESRGNRDSSVSRRVIVSASSRQRSLSPQDVRLKSRSRRSVSPRPTQRREQDTSRSPSSRQPVAPPRGRPQNRRQQTQPAEAAQDARRSPHRTHLSDGRPQSRETVPPNRSRSRVRGGSGLVTPVVDHSMAGTSARNRRIKKARECDFCGHSTGHMKRHIERTHLPWYLNPDRACFQCKRGFQSQHEVEQHQEREHHTADAYLTDANFRTWVRLVNGLLNRACRVLGLECISHLLTHVRSWTDERQSSANMTPRLLSTIRGWEVMNGLTPSDVITLQPPSSEGCLTWYVHTSRILLRMQPNQMLVVVSSDEESDYTGGTMPMVREPPIVFSDAHCHPLQVMAELGQTWEEITDDNSWSELRVRWVIANMVFPSDWQRMDEMARHGELRFTVGLHPNLAVNEARDRRFEQVPALVTRPGVVAVGETGLEYHHTQDRGGKQCQQRLLQSHCQLAKLAGLPLVIHCRERMFGECEARNDLLQILSHEYPNHDCRAMLHSFVGTSEDLAALLHHREIMISLGGAVLREQRRYWADAGRVGSYMDTASPITEMVRSIPWARLLLETDAPYLTPPGRSGETNVPWNVVEVATFVGRLWNLPARLVLDMAHNNLGRFFGLPL